MTATLIIGSNKGLGHETARQLVAVDPGYVATDMNGRTGTLSVEVGAKIIVRMAGSARTVPPAGTSTPAARWPGSPSAFQGFDGTRPAPGKPRVDLLPMSVTRRSTTLI